MKSFLLLGFFLLSSIFAMAEIVYVDITDKYFIEGSSSYSLNLDNNSGQDIWFYDQSWNQGTLALLLNFSGGSYHNFSASTECMPITSGTMIGSNSNWTVSTNVQMNTPWANTPFPNGVDRYIGVKTAGSRYAWVRVQYTPQALIIKDYAYENTGQPISAGNKGTVVIQNSYLTIEPLNGSTITTVPESQFMQFKVYLMPSNIDLTTSPSITWSIINSLGQATIDSNGLLHATQQGSIRIRAVHSSPAVTQGLLDFMVGPYVAGLEEGEKNIPVVSPNPANGKIKVLNTIGFEMIQVISLDGRLCIEQLINHSSETMNLGDLEPGNYLCVLKGQKRIQVLPFVLN